jgi:hypothetical protein
MARQPSPLTRSSRAPSARVRALTDYSRTAAHPRPGGCGCSQTFWPRSAAQRRCGPAPSVACCCCCWRGAAKGGASRITARSRRGRTVAGQTPAFAAPRANTVATAPRRTPATAPARASPVPPALTLSVGKAGFIWGPRSSKPTCWCYRTATNLQHQAHTPREPPARPVTGMLAYAPAAWPRPLSRRRRGGFYPADRYCLRPQHGRRDHIRRGQRTGDPELSHQQCQGRGQEHGQRGARPRRRAAVAARGGPAGPDIRPHQGP